MHLINSIFTIFLSVMFLFAEPLAGQQIQIVYERTTHTPLSRLYDFIPAESYSEVNRYTFTFSKQRSLFNLDSLKISGNKQHDGWAGVPSQNVVKDWAQNKMYVRRGNMQAGYAVRQDLIDKYVNAAGFEPVPEFREILGFKCQKMKAGAGGEIWFTTSIPYADGPFPFTSPSPGLVLLYRDESYEYLAVDLRLGAFTVEIPDYEFVDDKQSILLTLDEIRTAEKSQIIRIDSSTPNDVWLKFDEK